MAIIDPKSLLTGIPMLDTMILTLASDEQKGFVYDLLAPRFEVTSKKGSIPILIPSNKVKNNAPRQDDQPANQTLALSLAQLAYECESLDERIFIPNSIKHSDQVDKDLFIQGIVAALANLIKLKREKLLATVATTVGNYGSGYYDTPASGDKFDYSTAKPVPYILTKANLLRKATGFYPDSIQFSFDSWNAFIGNASVAPLLPDTRYRTVTEADVIPLLKTGALRYLENVIIAGAVEDTAVKKDTVTAADIWADDTIIFKKAKVQGKVIEPGAFVSVESTDPEDYGSMTYEPSNKEKGEWVEDRYACDPKMIVHGTVRYAYLIKDTNT